MFIYNFMRCACLCLLFLQLLADQGGGAHSLSISLKIKHVSIKKLFVHVASLCSGFLDLDIRSACNERAALAIRRRTLLQSCMESFSFIIIIFYFYLFFNRASPWVEDEAKMTLPGTKVLMPKIPWQNRNGVKVISRPDDAFLHASIRTFLDLFIK